MINKIIKTFREKERILVMFSGGVDSTLLAKIAYDALGERALAITVDSPIVPRSEIADAMDMAKIIGIQHMLIRINELDNEEFKKNPANRCYICRKIRDYIIGSWAHNAGFQVIADGMNFSDLGDYRPGLKAADEDGVWHPFIEFIIPKDDIRAFSKDLGLPSWDKPSTVCLCSRFPYGFEIEREMVTRVDKAEFFLKDLGFKEVRVRCLPYDAAVIEVDNIDLAFRSRDQVISKLKELGFLFITLDLEGFASGKMNRAIKKSGTREQ
jgi:uncharacterized protein